MEEGIEETRLWTVSVTGNRFFAEFPNNPPLDHDGGSATVQHLLLTRGQLHSLKGAAVLVGTMIEFRPMEGESSAQRFERMTRLRVKPIVDLPCDKCPSCPWFEPFVEKDVCGYTSLPRESSLTLLSESPLYLEAWATCPVRATPKT